MTPTPAEKAAREIGETIYYSSPGVGERTVKEFTAIIQAAIDEAMPKWDGIASEPCNKDAVFYYFPPPRSGVQRGVSYPGGQVGATHWMPNPLPQPPEDAR